MIQINIKEDFSENVAYDFKQYPIYIKRGCLSNYPNYAAVAHWHEDLEFIYVISGRMNYSVNGEIVELKEHAGIIVNSRNFHFGFSDEKQECDFVCVLIHPSLFASNQYIYQQFVKPLTECVQLSYRLLGKEPWQIELLKKICTLHELQKRDEMYFLECQQIVFQIFKLLYVNQKELIESDEKNISKSLIYLRKMVHFIQEHYEDSLTLEDIAREGAMGKTSCCYAFKKYMHTTPIEYLLTYRMAQSIRLLTETDKSITEIAYEVGFKDASYYTKSFKKVYGMTPREVRNENHC